MKNIQILLLLLLTATLLPAQNTWYVNQNATGLASGQSWTNAFPDLKTALTKAQAGDAIWVAQGTYIPDTGTNRDETFLLKSGVQLFGGFAGTESGVNQRIIAEHPVVLSGNIGDTADSTDNNYTILTLFFPDADTRIDGFILEHGYAVSDTNYYYNSPVLCGGAVYIHGENGKALPVFANCTFQHNVAQSNGGAIYVNGQGTKESLPIFQNCVFYNNQSLQRHGGAVSLMGGSKLDRGIEFDHCRFESNRATLQGGGIYFEHTIGKHTIDFIKCQVLKNKSETIGGFLQLWNDGVDLRIRIDSCDFIDNTAKGTVLMCHFPLNSTFNGKTIFNLSNSTLKGNVQTFTGGGTGSLFNFNNRSTSFLDSTIIFNNIIENNQSDYVVLQRAKNKYEVVENNIYKNNGFYDNGMTLIITNGVEKYIKNNIILFNTGYAIYETPSNQPNSKFNIENNVIVNSKLVGQVFPNSTYTISLIKLSTDTTNSNLIFRNNIVANNKDFKRAPVSGFEKNRSVLLYNNIITGNKDIYTNQPILPFNINQDSFFLSHNLTDVTCDQLPATTICGPGNVLASDALFVNPAQQDFHLQPCSPAIDKGLNAVAGTLDFDGNTRILGSAVDIGPFEHPAYQLTQDPVVDISCSENTASVSFSPENGCPPYYFNWQQGNQSGTGITGLEPGAYAFTITDSKGKIILQDVVVSEPTQLLTNVQITPSSTNIPGNGAIQVNIQSGDGPFKFIWSNGDTSSSINNLAPGVYSLTLIDGNDCIYTYSYTVLLVSATQSPDQIVGSVTPNPASGQVQIHFGAAASFQLYHPSGSLARSISKPDSGVAVVDLSDLPAGVYFYRLGAVRKVLVVTH
ncbi:MAG: choice-of-anchor Q domain-containing protein [Saprospiraceae bacterium]|nr:choice-of-anchor Q domain-containing protein [Saprospiraceae bacterium]